jgi:nitrogen fixation NifU-like protein
LEYKTSKTTLFFQKTLAHTVFCLLVCSFVRLFVIHLLFLFTPIILFCLQGLVGAPACGDVMKLQIKVDDDGNITDSVFKTFGCGSAIAASSVATEWVKGKSVDEVLAIKNSDIAAHLKLPPVKLHCSMLAEDAIKAAVKDWKEKQAEVKANVA